MKLPKFKFRTFKPQFNFTLIEVLVVISILAILTAILLPLAERGLFYAEMKGSGKVVDLRTVDASVDWDTDTSNRLRKTKIPAHWDVVIDESEESENFLVLQVPEKQFYKLTKGDLINYSYKRGKITGKTWGARIE